MTTKKTIFVLGAGASMPYGFPSGSYRVEEICTATQSHINPKLTTGEYLDDQANFLSREKIHEILISRFGSRDTKAFGEAVLRSNQSSIDAFLEHRTEFIEIGKIAIALFILRKEKEADLFSFDNRKNGCYQYLFSKLNAGWDEFGENQIGFITFNYDRSLEHFLFNALQNTYNKSEDDCAKKLSELPIIHLHGSLGKHRWQSKGGIQYGAGMDEDHVDNTNLVLAEK